MIVRCSGQWLFVLNALLYELQVNPNIKFEVFIHKVDGLSDDHKIGKSLAVGAWHQQCTELHYFHSTYKSLLNLLRN